MPAPAPLPFSPPEGRVSSFPMVRGVPTPRVSSSARRFAQRSAAPAIRQIATRRACRVWPSTATASAGRGYPCRGVTTAPVTWDEGLEQSCREAMAPGHAPRRPRMGTVCAFHSGPLFHRRQDFSRSARAAFSTPTPLFSSQREGLPFFQWRVWPASYPKQPARFVHWWLAL
jgi:hypothetical protein